MHNHCVTTRAVTWQRLEHEKHSNCYCICVTFHRRATSSSTFDRANRPRAGARAQTIECRLLCPFVEKRCPTAAISSLYTRITVRYTEPAGKHSSKRKHQPCPSNCKYVVLDAFCAAYELVVGAGPLEAPVAPEGAVVAAVCGGAAAPEGGSAFGALLCA